MAYLLSKEKSGKREPWFFWDVDETKEKWYEHSHVKGTYPEE